MQIWCNNGFTQAQQNELNQLRENIGDNELFLFPSQENGTDGESKKVLQSADIAFGAPDPDAVMTSANLKWIQINSAGYEHYDRADFKAALKERGTIFTNSSAVYVEPCAQHVLAMLMSLARALPEFLDDQRNGKSWKHEKFRNDLSLLNGQTAIIAGFGTIGRRVAELLAPFKMNLIGVKRAVRGDEPIHVIAQTEIDAVLPQADHVINILPANDSTNDFFDATRLSNFKNGARFYNIGRGTTVDQNALIAALNDGHIAAAYLDVMNPEPLPPDNPLWTTANCFITPHIAGGHRSEKIRQVEHFLDNVRRFTKGEPLTDRVF